MPPNPYVDLGVVKTVSADVVAPGATLTWTLVATNHGPGTSTGFVLADELPAGVTFVSATADAPLTCTTPAVGATGSVVCTAPSVPAPAGSSLTVTITADRSSGTAGGTVLRNVATVNGDQPEPTPDPHPNRDTTVTTRHHRQSDPTNTDPIRLTRRDRRRPRSRPATATCWAPRSPARACRCTRARTPRQSRRASRSRSGCACANVGEARADDVRVCDRLPRGLALVHAPGFRRSGGRLCRNLGHLGIGKARVVRITTRATRSAPLSVTNVATARASNARRVRARATVGVFARCAAAGPTAHIAC